MSNVFHDHLDVCEQCRNQPFNLCPVGSVKIREAAETIITKPQTLYDKIKHSLKKDPP